MKTECQKTPIGKIPKEWKVVRLGDKDICEIRGNKSINDVEEVAFIPMELISEQDIPTRYEMRKSENVKSYTYCESGDLLLAKITPSFENGKQGIVPPDIPNGFALATTEVFPMFCKGIERLFLFYILKFPKYRKVLEHSMTGTTGRQRVSKRAVKRLRIPLPPISEQRKIAVVLSKVDDAIRRVDEAVVKTERLKKGLMQKLLTEGIGHKEFKQTKMGKIPKEWEVVRLKQVSEGFISGGTPSTKEPKFWNGDIPWIRSVHLTKYYVDSSSVERYITRNGLENSAANIVPKNNLIVATRVGIGKSAINLIDIAINQDLIGVILDRSNIEPAFIVWYLNSSRVTRILESFSRGTTIKGISQSNLRSLLIPIPPIIEQREIAKILSAVDYKLELDRKRKGKLEHIKKGLMNVLLTGKKRVKV